MKNVISAYFPKAARGADWFPIGTARERQRSAAPGRNKSDKDDKDDKDEGRPEDC